ncbi:MAG: hypothetical protein ACRDJP_08975, partial [Actinomycetota bacterium]
MWNSSLNPPEGAHPDMARSKSILVTAATAALLAAGVPTTSAEPVLPVPSTLGCDSLDASACLLPFPNDFFTVPDAGTDTGRRVSFSPAAMPRSGTEVTEGGEGKPVDPTEWN